MCLLVGQRRCAFRRSCDAADVGLSSECFIWGGFDFSCIHPQGFVLTTLQRLDAERGCPRLPSRSRRGKEAELQGFVNFHQLVLSPPHPFKVREASIRYLAAAFVEMLWMCGPRVNSVSSVTPTNFGCEL